MNEATAVEGVPTQEETKLEKLIKMVRNFKSKAGAIIKINSKGGVYIKHPTFKAWSIGKNKSYDAGLNIDPYVFKALFSNKALLADLKQFCDALPDIELGQEQLEEFTKTYHVEKPAAEQA